MTRLMLVVMTLVFLPGAAQPRDQQRLQGPWTVVEAMRGDEVADDLVGHQIEFRADSFTITEEGRVVYQGTYSLDPDKPLKAIDFKHTGGLLKGKTWIGIYRISGDTLKICDNLGSPSAARPTEFDAKAKSGHVLVLFKRIVP